MLPRAKTGPSAKTVLSAAASAAATVVLIRSIAKDLLPYQIRHFLLRKIFRLFSPPSSEITITIDEVEGLHENQLFSAAEVYITSKITPSIVRLKAAIPAKETTVVLSIDKNQEVQDFFNGVNFKWTKVITQEVQDLFNGVNIKWTKVITQVPSTSTEYGAGYGSHIMGGGKTVSSPHFELSFHKKHGEMVVNFYFPHIISEAIKLKQEKKTLKIHTLNYDHMQVEIGQLWAAVNLNHGATFETLAMDLEMKRMIMEDLDMFVRRKDFYRKVGKAWKRGYLLYGPPGTGKSSLIAAMANYLNFDIYDLELTSLRSNSELRRLIIRTSNRSILVVEDIDCSIDLQRPSQEMTLQNYQLAQWHPNAAKLTLSGFLNFIDGLWSNCGDERIIIFTTNHKERLDPALIRAGRMDVHIHLSYCTPCAFKMLASNYLGVTHHRLFSEVEPLIRAVNITPAEVAEQLMKAGDTEAVLQGLVELLKAKEEESELNANNPV